VNCTDRQNWASAQRICAQKTRACLRELQIGQETHQERTLGTEMYLKICVDYVDIFLSVTLDLRARVVLASKVSFFFRIWKLWLKFGDHTIGGNSRNLTAQESFVSQQCFLDIQISCHFVVLLIKYFRDSRSHLHVPLHLICSDSCEIFFSKVGGMQGMERAYDFHELVNCTNTLNQLSAIEYGANGLQFLRVHNKQCNFWGELHPLQEGQPPHEFGDYSKIRDDSNLVLVLTHYGSLPLALLILFPPAEQGRKIFTHKISRLFWLLLGLKYVIIDMWANDQNETMFSYFIL
jgi:hypothetical protein